MSSLVVIPTYNEASNIGVLIPRIFKWIPTCSILIVDDGSPDGTSDIVRELQRNFPELHLLTRNQKSGLGSAYRAGFAWGLGENFERFIEMDADMSHRVRDLAKMLATSNDENPGLVIGSRWMSGGATSNWSKSRELLSRTANKYVQLMLGIRVKDSTSGFRIYSRSLLERIDLDSIKSEGYSFQIEMTRAALKAGAEILEVPIVFRERVDGVSKMSKAIVREAIWRVTIWGFQRALRIDGGGGGI